MADWEIDANGNLVKVGATDNGINPTTGLPWGVYPNAESPTGYTHTESGTPVYKDGAAWSGTTSNRAPSGGTTVYNTNTPASWATVYDSNGLAWSYNELTGESKPVMVNGVQLSKGGAGNSDPDGDGYDNSTGLPVGVVKEGTGSNATYWYLGQRVNRDGSPYQGGTGPSRTEILIDTTGSVTGRKGTSYYYDSNGIPHTLVTGTASSSSSSSGSGGSSANNYSGGGGSSSGGSSAGGGLTTHAGGYNNTSTSIHEGGYTNTNISEIGPLEAAMRASEFAANNALAQDKRQQELATLYSQQLRDVDPNAYQVFLEKMGGGRLDNALLSGGNALSENALRGAATSLGALNGMNTPASAGGGLTSSAGGGDPTSPGAGGGVGVPAAAPAAAEAPAWDGSLPPMTVSGAEAAMFANSMANPFNTLPVAGPMGTGNPIPSIYGGPQEWTQIQQMLFDKGMNATSRNPGSDMRTDRYGSSYQGGGGTQSIDPSRPGYVAERPSTPYYLPPDPRIAAQAGDDIQREIPDPLKQFAFGGMTREPRMIVGDPQVPGRPNPEIIHNPTNAPISVVPMNAMQNANQNARFMMPPQRRGGLSRYAFGTDDEIWADNLSNQSQPAPMASPATSTSWLSSPSSAPATSSWASPFQSATVPAAPTQPVNNPTQIGGYSTAPGTAGQPTPGMTTTAPPPPISGPVYDGGPQTAPVGGTGGHPALVPRTQPSSGGSIGGWDLNNYWGRMMNRPIGATLPAPYAPPLKDPTAVAPFDPGRPSTMPVNPADYPPPIPTQPIVGGADRDENGRGVDQTTGAVGPNGLPVGIPGPIYDDGQTSPAPANQPAWQTSGNGGDFDEVLNTRLRATNPWMNTPDAYMNVDYLTRDPMARRNYEQYLTLRFGVPQESIDFAQARNRLGGASMASMAQGR